MYGFEWHLVGAIDRISKEVFSFSSRSHRAKRTHLINLNMQIAIQTPLSHQTGSSIKLWCIKLCVFREKFSFPSVCIRLHGIVVPSTKPAKVVSWHRANPLCALSGVCKSMSLQREIDYSRARLRKKTDVQPVKHHLKQHKWTSYSMRFRGKGWFVFFAKSITTISNATTASRDER